MKGIGLQTYISRRKPVNIGLDFIKKDNWQLCFDLLRSELALPKSAVDPWGFASETSEEPKDLLGTVQQVAIPRNIPVAIAYRTYQPYLKAQREYFSHFHNYLTQAVDVTVMNFNVSKLKNKRDQEAVAAELKRRGIKTDGAHLSTRNFWDAKQQLHDYQRQFRLLLGHVAKDSLAEIEAEEQSLIPQTWLLWHHYAHKPNHTRKKPVYGMARNAENEQRVIDRWIAGTLSRFNDQERNAQRLFVDMAWEGKSTLVIQLDVFNPTNLYEAFEELIGMLKSRFRSLRYEDLKHYLMQEYYEQTIIIPTFRGRMAYENAWNLYSLSTILNRQSLDNQNWASYQMKPLTQEWIDATGLEFWEDSQVKLANEISAVVSGLMILVSQIGELKDLPEEIIDEAAELLQSHTMERSKAMSELLQKFIDHGVTIQNQLASLSETERAKRPYLVDAVSLFHELFESVMPSDSDTGEYRLNLNEIHEYAERLSQIFLYAEQLRLLLISDALSK